MVKDQRPSSVRTALGWLLLAIGFLWLGMWTTEWWPILISGSDAVVAEYHFGSEPMVGYGGWKYSNPETYGWSTFAFGVVGLAVAGLLRAAVIRRSWSQFIVAGALCVLWWATTTILENVEWERHDELSEKRRAG